MKPKSRYWMEWDDERARRLLQQEEDQEEGLEHEEGIFEQWRPIFMRKPANMVPPVRIRVVPHQAHEQRAR